VKKTTLSIVPNLGGESAILSTREVLAILDEDENEDKDEDKDEEELA